MGVVVTVVDGSIDVVGGGLDLVGCVKVAPFPPLQLVISRVINNPTITR